MNPFYKLGPTISSAWAKSDSKSDDWMPLVQHCADAAEVARIYWRKFMADSSRQVVERSLSSFESDIVATGLEQRLAIFLAAAHDIGKASPAFAMQVPHLADRMRRVGYDFPSLTSDERRRMPHSVVSYLHLEDWLHRRYDLHTAISARTLAVVLGGHHGVYPTSSRDLSIQSRLAGTDPLWSNTRDSLLDAAFQVSGLADEELRLLATNGINQPSQLVLTAFVIVCDWIASNTDYFPYHVDSSPEIRATGALAELDLPEPWRPEPLDDDRELFNARFMLPSEAQIRPVQQSAMQIARKVARPGLIIIEAPPGEGKTEAALGAAELLAARFGCGGVLTALPTQATSNAMFSREQHWLRNAVPPTQLTSISLCHGKAQFNEEFQQLRHPRFTAIHDDDNSSTDGTRNGLLAHWWLSGRKKATLADFVVGTIDQVLLAALNSRHLMLRHLGMAGKVVILDEVHAADAYMAVYLDRALEWLGALGVPVIALSATLPPARRVKMLDAYQRGRGDQHDDRDLVAKLAADVTDYPLISTSEIEVPSAPVPPSGREQSIRFEFMDEDMVELAAVVTASVASGGCVAVVHNTVDRAQQTYRDLKANLGDDVVLLHSRFITIDRLTKESDLVRQLGSPSVSDRPKRLVVVSTQVIEQSLDLDFDLIFTDMAPIDSLIQRSGRLHRHARPEGARPSNMREARMVITGFTSHDGCPPDLVQGSRSIYGDSVLLRSLSTLQSHLSKERVLTSPDNIAPLVRDTYDPGLSAPFGWEQAWADATAQELTNLMSVRKRAEQGCVKPPVQRVAPLLGWATLQPNEKDESAAIQAVRDTADTIEAVAVVRDDTGVVRSLPWLDNHANEQVDLGTEIPHELARAVARCTVKLPEWMARGKLGDRIVSALEEDGFATWQASDWLKGELPLILDANLTRDLGGYILRYDQDLGLLVMKGNQE